MKAPSGIARFLTLRTVVVLGLVTLAEAAVACWVLAAPGTLPFSGLVPLTALPQTLCGVALALAALAAPFLYREDESRRWERELFAALWQAFILAYFLFVAARLKPLDDGGVLLAAVALALTALVLSSLTLLWPRLYAGVVFVWLVGVPVFGYFLAEVYLWSAGLSDWDAAQGAVSTCLHWLLNFSPGTAIIGALTGFLADGTPPHTLAFVLLLCALAGALMLALSRRSRITAALGLETHVTSQPASCGESAGRA